MRIYLKRCKDIKKENQRIDGCCWTYLNKCWGKAVDGERAALSRDPRREKVKKQSSFCCSMGTLSRRTLKQTSYLL